MGGQRWGTKWVRAESLLGTQEGDHGHHGALERETPPCAPPKQREKGGRDRLWAEEEAEAALCHRWGLWVCGATLGRIKNPETLVFNPLIINTWGVQLRATSTLTDPNPCSG